jgi:hypothetical protein
MNRDAPTRQVRNDVARHLIVMENRREVEENNRLPFGTNQSEQVTVRGNPTVELEDSREEHHESV